MFYSESTNTRTHKNIFRRTLDWGLIHKYDMYTLIVWIHANYKYMLRRYRALMRRRLCPYYIKDAMTKEDTEANSVVVDGYGATCDGCWTLPGPSGVTSLWGVCLAWWGRTGSLRAHWIIGPPFMDRKSLATMSSAGGLVGVVSSRNCSVAIGGKYSAPLVV